MNTHESYVSLETAKMLKEAGFDWECREFYKFTDEGYKLDWNALPMNWNQRAAILIAQKQNRPEAYSAPTLAVVQRWLIEVKGYLVESVLCANRKNMGNSFGFSITSISSNLSECRMVYPCSYYDEEESKDFMKYEYALEAGIQKCLTILLRENE